MAPAAEYPNLSELSGQCVVPGCRVVTGAAARVGLRRGAILGNVGGHTPSTDVTRDYDRFSDLSEEFARSRIYGGIHYQFDSDASQSACPKVAEYAFAHFMIER